MMSGMVMNGPTPIMSIMFSVVEPRKPTPRISCDSDAAAPSKVSVSVAIDEILYAKKWRLSSVVLVAPPQPPQGERDERGCAAGCVDHAVVDGGCARG